MVKMPNASDLTMSSFRKYRTFDIVKSIRRCRFGIIGFIRMYFQVGMRLNRRNRSIIPVINRSII